MDISTSKDPMSTVSITDALRAERYDLNSDSAALDRRLLREVEPERQAALRSIWNVTDEEQRLESLCAFPRTAREAHLLFSHDRARIRDSFHWALSRAPFAGPIVDLGCGTGTLLRILRGTVASTPLVGVERAPNLVAIGRELSRGQANIEIVEGSYDTAQPAHAPFLTLISISPVRAFVRERCVIGANMSIAIELLYSAFKNWCDYNGHPKNSKQVFGRDLRASLPRIRVGRPRDGDDRIRVYQGITVRPDHDISGQEGDI
jgi:SAM-dependent methyltransferase